MLRITDSHTTNLSFQQTDIKLLELNLKLAGSKVLTQALNQLIRPERGLFAPHRCSADTSKSSFFTTNLRSVVISYFSHPPRCHKPHPDAFLRSYWSALEASLLQVCACARCVQWLMKSLKLWIVFDNDVTHCSVAVSCWERRLNRIKYIYIYILKKKRV